MLVYSSAEVAKSIAKKLFDTGYNVYQFENVVLFEGEYFGKEN